MGEISIFVKENQPNSRFFKITWIYILSCVNSGRTCQADSQRNFMSWLDGPKSLEKDFIPTDVAKNTLVRITHVFDLVTPISH